MEIFVDADPLDGNRLLTSHLTEIVGESEAKKLTTKNLSASDSLSLTQGDRLASKIAQELAFTPNLKKTFKKILGQEKLTSIPELEVEEQVKFPSIHDLARDPSAYKPLVQAEIAKHFILKNAQVFGKLAVTNFVASGGDNDANLRNFLLKSNLGLGDSVIQALRSACKSNGDSNNWN